jgi:hypothetical protein
VSVHVLAANYSGYIASAPVTVIALPPIATATAAIPTLNPGGLALALAGLAYRRRCV